MVGAVGCRWKDFSQERRRLRKAAARLGFWFAKSRSVRVLLAWSAAVEAWKAERVEQEKEAENRRLLSEIAAQRYAERDAAIAR